MALYHRLAVCLLFVIYNVNAEIDLPFLKQCKLDDFPCSKQIWQDAVPYLSRGLPELSMPPLDPMKITNFKVAVPNLFDIYFIEGVMKGYKTCIIDDFKWKNVKKGSAGSEIDLHCNITIKGHYNASATTNLIPGISGDGAIRADGDMKIKLPNLKLKFIFDFKIVKNEVGETILLLKTPIKYKYVVTGPVPFKANNIFLGDQDISELVVNVMNASWRTLIDRFSGPFFKKAMELVGEVEKNFFKGVPVTKYIADDMEQYVE